MSAPGFGVDVAQLEGVAAALENAAEPLAGVADLAADVPQAGPVTGEVTAHVTALAEAVSGLVGGTASTAGAARSAADSYRSSDTQARSVLDPTSSRP